jgi:membrane protein YdbS with pleckstrin-like domain
MKGESMDAIATERAKVWTWKSTAKLALLLLCTVGGYFLPSLFHSQHPLTMYTVVMVLYWAAIVIAPKTFSISPERKLWQERYAAKKAGGQS